MHACTISIGLPFPPINLDEELSLVMNSGLVNITFTWQPPLGLVIDDDLMYIVSVNISILNLTDHFEVITNNLSYTHEINQLCTFSYETVQAVVHTSLSSKNKVGIGMEIHKEILLNSKCVNPIPDPDPITTSDLG